MCGRHNKGRKEEKPEALWEKLSTSVDLEENTLLLGQAFLGCTQRECKTNKKDRGRTSENVRILDLTRYGETIAPLGAIPSLHYFVVLRHGRTRKEMRRKILRIIK